MRRLDVYPHLSLRDSQRPDLEGIVAQREADPYGPKTVWYKVKNRAYSQRAGRFEALQRR